MLPNVSDLRRHALGTLRPSARNFGVLKRTDSEEISIYCKHWIEAAPDGLKDRGGYSKVNC